MTPGSTAEYIEAIRWRYRRARKGEKGRMLDEAERVTGYHRKALVRLLGRGVRPAPRRRGRAKVYGAEPLEPLRVLWEAVDRICPQRLRPFAPELIRVLRRHGNQRFPATVERQLVAMSPATMERLLRPLRRQGGWRPGSTTKPGTLLKGAIPIRTFAEWNEGRPGFLEVDLVAHGGESSEGFFLNTLSAVDVATGWVERQAVWGKSQERVGGALELLRRRLPFPLLGLDSDNGGEFINHHLLTYCQRHRITFTRSRPYKKNDSAHVEQKNWAVVRRMVGYQRFSSRAAWETLNRLYGQLHWYVNFFQPVRKLLHKSRQGAKLRKIYGTAQTPYQRALKAQAPDPAQQVQLESTYRHLNPVWLLQQINTTLDHLWRLAERPPHSSTVSSIRVR